MVIRNVEDQMAQLEVNGQGSKENYVYVDSQSEGMGAPIPVASSEQWQEEILKDPKV